MGDLPTNRPIGCGPWRQFAACRSAGPGLLFPVPVSGVGLRRGEEAKAICADDEFTSPWYTGHDCSHAPEPGPYQQWREARSDWVATQRPEDFERMLAAVTPDNPPLASDIHGRDCRPAVGRWPRACTSGSFATAPLPAAHDLVRQAVTLAAAAIIALATVVVLILGVALASILAVIQGGTWPGHASAARPRRSRPPVPWPRSRRASGVGLNLASSILEPEVHAGGIWVSPVHEVPEDLWPHLIHPQTRLPAHMPAKAN